MTQTVRVIEIPIRTWSEANARIHWAVRAKRAKNQRGLARLLTKSEVNKRGPINTGSNTISIELRRFGPRMLDSDNLAGACKAIRDGIADGIGINDGDPRITWTYTQERSKKYFVVAGIVC